MGWQAVPQSRVQLSVSILSCVQVPDLPWASVSPDLSWINMEFQNIEDGQSSWGSIVVQCTYLPDGVSEAHGGKGLSQGHPARHKGMAPLQPAARSISPQVMTRL